MLPALFLLHPHCDVGTSDFSMHILCLPGVANSLGGIGTIRDLPPPPACPFQILSACLVLLQRPFFLFFRALSLHVELSQCLGQLQLPTRSPMPTWINSCCLSQGWCSHIKLHFQFLHYQAELSLSSHSYLSPSTDFHFSSWIFSIVRSLSVPPVRCLRFAISISLTILQFSDSRGTTRVKLYCAQNYTLTTC